MEGLGLAGGTWEFLLEGVSPPRGEARCKFSTEFGLGNLLGGGGGREGLLMFLGGGAGAGSPPTARGFLAGRGGGGGRPDTTGLPMDSVRGGATGAPPTLSGLCLMLTLKQSLLSSLPQYH